LNRQVSASEQPLPSSLPLAVHTEAVTTAAVPHDANATGSFQGTICQISAIPASTAAITTATMTATATATATAPATATTPDTEPEPTLDELIEAYVAFDELCLFEQNMHKHFVQACFGKAHSASLASIQTRSKRKSATSPTVESPDKGLGLNPPHLPSHKDSTEAQEDRRILPAEFRKIQETLGITFTLDACANPDGSNAHCTHYCSKEDSFLDRDLANETVWLNLPFAHMRLYFDHFLQQKRLHPELQGCILVPKWKSALTHPVFSHMKLVTTYKKGHYLFDAPNRPTQANGRSQLP
jgi:hypothetical protein